MIFLQLIAFILILGLIISIHELGHFIFAKRADILCHEFSIGMGPILAKKRKGETLYALRAIPIGGYVLMAGEQDSVMFKEKDKIGLNFKNDLVSEIILDESRDASVSGIVVEYDLYKEKESDYLHITLNVDGEIKTYYVLENAFYILKKGEPLQISTFERSYESKSLINRFLTCFMGPFMNFILAFFLFFLVGLCSGKPDLSKAKIGEVSSNEKINEKSEVKIADNSKILEKNDKILGMYGLDNEYYSFETWKDFQVFMDNNCGLTGIKTKISRNNKESYVFLNTTIIFNNIGLASSANLDKVEIGQVFGRSDKSPAKPGMIIKSVAINNGEAKEISSWKEMVDIFKDLKSSKVDFVLLDKDKEVKYSIKSFDKVISMQNATKVSMKIGVGPSYNFNFGYSFIYSAKSMWSNIKQVYQTLGLLILGTEGIGVKDLSGPIGIFSLTGQYMAGGIISLIAFAGFLSVNIGFVNLLPIPALDGGRIVFLLYEAITKKRVSKKVENTAISITMILLLLLIAYVSFNDILRLF